MAYPNLAAASALQRDRFGTITELVNETFEGLPQIYPLLNKELPQSTGACGNLECPEGVMAQSC